ncbi:MAG: RluA family pseudouridine synthase [Rhodobacterales bacterium]|jgi:23S rRNA pseudouridine1911/1915/1917 synthase|nr:RluA family pseudouridine synthase [Pseudomonadota bacterium]MDA1287284.1 RluA family pseudouridine synthase [Pseudomonadota bacterium]NQW12879.1 RluA family pseudouridine synthase [Rhodobacter sp.]HBN32187.1 RNA pseudouridine synthase [Paracoccaceae bacterium]
MSDPILRVVIGENPPPRLDKALAEVVPEDASLSRSSLGKLIEAGAVAREGGGVVTVLKTKTQVGEVFLITVPEAVDIEAQPEAIPLDVIFEDDDLIVINKPAGMVVHPAPGSETGTLVNALLAHCADSLSGIGGAKRPGIVHRIDKDTSGLLVVAKSDRAHHGLAAQFADHSIERHYLAICYGVPSRADPRLAGISGVAFEGSNVIRLSGNIARHKTDRKRQAVVVNAGRHAITRLRVVESYGTAAALVECWLETGRTHQIRVHLTHAGHTLIGDMTYGGKRTLGPKLLSPAALDAVKTFPRQALHAASLGFKHPVTQETLTFAAELPEDMQQLLTALSST